MSSCGFCGSIQSGENISNCVKRIQYKREYCEYVVSKSDEGNIHLKNRLQNNLPLPTKDYPNNIVSLSVGSNRGKHIIITNIWLKRQTQPLIGPKQISNMLFEISYIDKQGEIKSSKRTICGEEFEFMIHIMKFCNKKTFIYDATATQMDTYQEEYFFYSD